MPTLSTSLAPLPFGAPLRCALLRLALVGFTLWAGVALPRIAEAGCGRYIVFRGPTNQADRRLASTDFDRRQVITFDHLGLGSFAHSSQQGDNPWMPAAPVCKGRDCSRDSFAPPATLRVLERSSSLSVVNLLRFDLADESSLAKLALPFASECRRASDLWRPPRLLRGV